MKRQWILGAALAAGVVVGGTVTACEVPFYVYSARRWNAADACVEPYTPIDRVEGEGADSSCPAVCLTVGATLYVSTVCPPLPVSATEVPATDPTCRAALDAIQRNRICGEPAEGGADAEPDAGEDATDAADAPTDPDADAAAADADASDAPADG